MLLAARLPHLIQFADHQIKRDDHDLYMNLFTPPPSPVDNTCEDILVSIFDLLDLRDLHSMRLVNRRLSSLINSKVVWVNLLRRLKLPIPSMSRPLEELAQPELERLAVRASRLDANWRSSRPSPSNVRTIPLDSVIVLMAMCQGVLFTAHKDGRLRCWRDVDSPYSPVESRPSGGREDPRRFLSLVPEARITKFSYLQVCQDPSKTHFVVVYGGDGVDRRTHCGVFHVPVNQRDALTSSPKARHFEESKGILSISASPTAIIVARAQGNISVIDFATGSNYCIDGEATRTGPANKLLRAQALPNDQVLVLTSDTFAVYPMPSASEPHVDTPSFIRTMPKSVAGWVHDTASSESSTPTFATTVSVLTETNDAIRYSFRMPTSDDATWDLHVEAQGPFPYPLERLTMTEMLGGERRSIWIHWRRGFEDWPIHVLGSHRDPPTPNNEELPSSESNAETGGSALSTGATATGFNFRSLAAVNSEAPETPTTPETDLARQIWSCTRSVSMPRLCFDEATGRVHVAGSNSPVLAVCDYA